MVNEDAYASAHDLPEGHEEFLSYVRSCKVSAVQDNPDNPDLPPAVRAETCTPLGVEVCAFTAGLDEATSAAATLCTMLRPCSLTLAADTYAAHDEAATGNPATGRPWAHGELQQHWEAGNADGLVTETMSFITVWRNGRCRLEEAPYVVTGNTMRWTGKTVLDSSRDGHGLGGGLHDQLQQFLHAPRPASMVMLADLFEAMGLSVADRFAREVMTTIKMLQEQNILVAVGGSDPRLMDLLAQDAGAIMLSQRLGSHLDPTLADLDLS